MEALLKSMDALARRAGRIMADAPNAPAHPKEGHYNFVTDADIQVQKLLISELRALVPEAEFLAEEQENQRLTAKPTFIIDPIDGTLNFMRDRHCSAISIALAVDKRVELGLVYNPYRDEMFTALRGGGARCNGAPIHVSDKPFDLAMVAMGTSPYNASLARRTLDVAYDFLTGAGDLRRMGSAALDLCDVACGRADIYFELQLSPWDFSAGVLMVTEAGGNVLMPRDAETGMNRFDMSGCILAANPECFEGARGILERHDALE